jgi:hypothetical protein
MKYFHTFDSFARSVERLRSRKVKVLEGFNGPRQERGSLYTTRDRLQAHADLSTLVGEIFGYPLHAITGIWVHNKYWYGKLPETANCAFQRQFGRKSFN